jgi:hypothetical protein
MFQLVVEAPQDTATHPLTAAVEVENTAWHPVVEKIAGVQVAPPHEQTGDVHAADHTAKVELPVPLGFARYALATAVVDALPNTTLCRVKSVLAVPTHSSTVVVPSGATATSLVQVGVPIRAHGVWTALATQEVLDWSAALVDALSISVPFVVTQGTLAAIFHRVLLTSQVLGVVRVKITSSPRLPIRPKYFFCW